MHYRFEGKKSGKAVLLLHQTPRSSDEFLEVISLLAKKNFFVLAPDTIGMGDSYKPTQGPFTIEKYAMSMFKFLDKLGVRSTNIVGHHTGAVVAMEMAALHPERVRKVVLSDCPYVDSAVRSKMKKRPPVDEFEIKEDGSHLIDLWNRRRAFYPKHRPDLLNRLIIDILKSGTIAEEGHRAVTRYEMEKRIGLVKCKALVLCGTADKFAYPDMEMLASKLKLSTTAVIPGGMVPMPDQMPTEFARVVSNFLLGKG